MHEMSSPLLSERLSASIDQCGLGFAEFYTQLNESHDETTAQRYTAACLKSFATTLSIMLSLSREALNIIGEKNRFDNWEITEEDFKYTHISRPSDTGFPQIFRLQDGDYSTLNEPIFQYLMTVARQMIPALRQCEHDLLLKSERSQDSKRRKRHPRLFE